MEENDIREICLAHQLQCNKITKAIGSFDKELFFIDDKYLIRISKQSMREEQIKIDRVKALKHVPKIIHASDQSSKAQSSKAQNSKAQNSKAQNSKAQNTYYLILEYIQGTELLTDYNKLSDQDIYNIGDKISEFLFELHNMKGDKYDIGHYVPIIPAYDKSWRSGHQAYWEDIYKGLQCIQLSEDIRQVLELSNEYINANLSSLDYENGPSLLHNDFHFKNIILHKNTFSGVIDWECSQYGEADFDLIHLLHWSLFPPSKDIDFMKLFNTVFRLYLTEKRIPRIETRLIIYLLEHDFIQILWSQGKRADEYRPRIKYWLSGSLERYIQELLTDVKN